MNFAEAARIVSALPRPHTFPKRGRLLYKHIRENKPENVLELGTAGGGSAVFIAAALEANGSGHLTSVDSLRWTWEDPTPLEVLEKAGLSDLVILDRRFSTYTWFLKTEIEKHLDDAGWVRPAYDLISWTARRAGAPTALRSCSRKAPPARGVAAARRSRLDV